MTAVAHSACAAKAATSRIRVVWLALFALFTLLYLLTAQRGVSWQDSGMFQWRILNADYVGELGLALAHPLYIGMGRAVGAVNIGNFAWRVNALSGMGLGLMVANLAGAIHALTGKRSVATVVAGTIGLAHTAWWLGTVAEVYTWSAAGLAGEVWLAILLIRRPDTKLLALLALISGLGWSLHNFALLALPVHVALACWLIWGKRRLSPWSLAWAGAAYVIGSGAYLVMITQLAIQVGVSAAVRSALFGEYTQQVLAVAPAGGLFKVNMALSTLNFANLLLPLAVVGWLSFRRLERVTAVAMGTVTAIHVLFFVRYPVPDQFTFILPSLVMVGLWAGVGLSRLVDTVGARGRRILTGVCVVSALAQPMWYALAPALVHRLGLSPAREVSRPTRDEAGYWLLPWKHDERSAESFARQALEEVSPRSIIIADSTSIYPLWVTQQLENSAPGVMVTTTVPPKEELNTLYSATPRRGFEKPHPQAMLYKYVSDPPDDQNITD